MARYVLYKNRNWENTYPVEEIQTAFTAGLIILSILLILMGYGVINGKPVKLIPDGVEFPLEPVKALLMHNIKEFTHLASILPEVYGEFKDKFTF